MAFSHLLQDLYIPIQFSFLAGYNAGCSYSFPLAAGKLERDDLEFVKDFSEMDVHRQKLPGKARQNSLKMGNK